MIPQRFLRSIALATPIFTAAALFGLTDSFAKINVNLFASGITLGRIIAVLNLYLLFLIFKKRLP